MWKKEDAPEPTPSVRGEVTPIPERTAPAKATGERATIGRSIAIHGEVTGDEDLLIQGRVEGSVNLKQHSITIGPEGEVKADVTGRVVTVEGSVEGNLVAQEQIILRRSALVQGDITAPRIVLEDGARFRGGVDMGETVDWTGQGGDSKRAVTGAAETARIARSGVAASSQTSTSNGEQNTSSDKSEAGTRTAAQVTR
jgi:cytoskeletal protein CcmA (bactofilin family)